MAKPAPAVPDSDQEGRAGWLGDVECLQEGVECTEWQFVIDMLCDCHGCYETLLCCMEIQQWQYVSGRVRGCVVAWERWLLTMQRLPGRHGGAAWIGMHGQFISLQ